METFNEPEEDAAGWLAAAPALWEQQDHVERFAHLAFVDGRPVGFAFAFAGPVGLLLGGSGVLAAARGRGAYRALLAARWQEAARLGKPALVIQAGAMSRPILERSGFESICSVDVLEDPDPAGRASNTRYPAQVDGNHGRSSRSKIRCASRSGSASPRRISR